MRLIFLGVLFPVFFLACNPSQESGNQIQFREEKNFNKNWFFAIDSLNEGETHQWYKSTQITTDTLSVSIPHTWNVMDGLESYFGTGWYFKFFRVPEKWKGKRVRLIFQAIYRDVRIWVNGNVVGERNGSGYTPFEIDLSDELYFDRENLIAVKVSNEFSPHAIPLGDKFDWAADGGIIRTVTLIKTENPYIASLQVVPRMEPGHSGTLAIRIGIGGLPENNGTMDVWWQVREHNQDPENMISEGNQKVGLVDSTLSLEIKIDRIRPWHFNLSNLYQLRIAIGEQFTLLDHAETTFGFRSLITRGDRLIFNGEPVRLPGIEWMPGSNPEFGMAEDSSVIIRMLDLLKNTHAVITRFHWQQDEMILDWCDRNGILVQEEIPLWQAPYPEQITEKIRNLAFKQISEMIGAHRNHPSIFAWGIGNELQAQNDTIKEFLVELKDHIYNLDSDRLINYVSNTFQVQPVKDGTDIGDVLMWNDYSGLWYNMSGDGLTSEMLPETLLDFKKSVPGKSLIISEYGLCEPVFKGGDPRRIDHFLYNTDIYDQNDWISGVIYFSLNDYRTHMGEEGTGKFRQRVHGIVDIYGNKKPSYEVVRKRFSPIEQLGVRIIGQNLHVTGKNRNGLPSYTLYGYVIRLYGENEKLIAEEPIPDLDPGQAFNVTFREINRTTRMISIVTRNGYVIASKLL